MNEFTILILRPDHARNGHPSHWVHRAWETANTAAEAVRAALDDLALADLCYVDELAVLAVYEDHIIDYNQIERGWIQY